MKVKKFFKKKVVIIPFAIYMFLWLLTATWGTYDVRSHFDKQFEYGYPNLSDEKIKITNIDSFYVYSLDHEHNQDKIPSNSCGLFRYKSIGIAIAPFVVIDNMATIWGGLAGLGATRFNFWFFGYNWWYPIIPYWCA